LATYAINCLCEDGHSTFLTTRTFRLLSCLDPKIQTAKLLRSENSDC